MPMETARRDLLGITSRLDHIKSLGVDAIWLNPCFPSPQQDRGYDVADHFDIEPDYGTLLEFDALVSAARAHDIRIILDVVPNHCSTEHPWFAAAVAAAPGSSPSVSVTRVHADPPKIAFQLFGDRGVDGFRADAVIYLGKVDGLPDADPSDVDSPLNPLYTYVPWQHEIWRQWRDLVNRYEAAHGRELLLVAEAFSPNDPELMVAYANPDEFHQVFAFDLMLASWHADRIRAVIKSTLDAAFPHGLLPAWTLNNHDTQRSPTR